MRRALSVLFGVLLLTASAARADQAIPSPPTLATHTRAGLLAPTDKLKLDGLVVPSVGTDLLRFEDVAVGSCILSGTGVSAPIICTTGISSSLITGTPNTVGFFNSGGALAEDPLFKYTSSNHRLYLSTTNAPDTTMSGVLNLQSESGSGESIGMYASAGFQNEIVSDQSRGTRAAPAAVQAGDVNFDLLSRGYDGNSYQLSMLFGTRVPTDATVSAGNVPQTFWVGTDPTGGTTASAAPDHWGLGVTHKRNVFLGEGSISPGATDGFPYFPAGAGPPSGAPTYTFGGTQNVNRDPVYLDDTGRGLYSYMGGAWRLLGSAAATSTATIYADGIATGSTQLASVASVSITAGTIAYVASVDDYFKLTLDTTTTDGITHVAASGKAGYEWVRLGIFSLRWNAVNTFYVNPGSGSDEADGLTSGTALNSAAELSRRLTGRTAGTTVTINLLADATDSDVLALSFTPGGASVTVVGVENVSSIQTIASATAPSYSGNTLNQITVTSFSWAPYVGHFIRKGTAGGVGTYAVVLADLGGGTAVIGPCAVNGSASGSASFAATDSISILTMTKVPQIRATNVSTVSVLFGSMLRSTGSWIGSVVSPSGSFGASWSTFQPGSSFISSIRAFSTNLNVVGVSTGFSTTSSNAVSVLNTSFIGASPTVTLGAAGASVSIGDVVLYPSSTGATVPVMSLPANGTVTITPRSSPTIGLGVFNLASGSVGVAIGGNSLVTVTNIFGANNNAASWVLALPRGSKMTTGAPVNSTFSESSSAGVKVDWITSPTIGAGTSLPNSFAGQAVSLTDRYNSGRGPAVASASALAPAGMMVFREWTVTGTTTINTIGYLPETNAVANLNDGTIIELDIQNGLTITNGASPSTGFGPVALVGGTNAVLPAGSHIVFRFNKIFASGAGTWSEVSRDSGPALSIQGVAGNSAAQTLPISASGANRIFASDGTGNSIGFQSTIPWSVLNSVPNFVLDPGSNGIMVRDALGASIARSLTNTDGTVNISNPDGIAGNPIINTTGLTPTARTLTMASPMTCNGTSSCNLSTNLTLATPTFGTSSAGLVPPSGGGTANFLRADGTFAPPPGTSGITSLTGPVTGTGPGATATAINLAGGSISNTLPCANAFSLTGDVTSSGCSATIAGLALAKLAPLGSHSWVANPTGSTGSPAALSYGPTSGIPQLVIGSPDTINVYAAGAGHIPFGSGTNGQLTDSANLTTGVDAELHLTAIDDTTPATISAWDTRHFVVGKSGPTGLGLGVSTTNSGSVVNLSAAIPGSAWAALRLQADTFSLYSDATTLGFKQDASGNVYDSQLTTNGILKTIGGSGEHAIASASDIAAAQVWPTTNRVLISGGPSSAPVGDPLFTYDPTTHTLSSQGATKLQSFTGLLNGTLGTVGTEIVIGGLSESGGTLTGVAFVGSGSSHAMGMVPDPGSVAGTARFLREDGVFQTIAGPGSTNLPIFIDSTGAALTGSYGVVSLYYTQNVQWSGAVSGNLGFANSDGNLHDFPTVPISYTAGHATLTCNVDQNTITSGAITFSLVRNSTNVATFFSLSSVSGTGIFTDTQATGSSSSTDTYALHYQTSGGANVGFRFSCQLAFN